MWLLLTVPVVPLPLLPLPFDDTGSLARDVLDRDDDVASANVARAGVDGLLARPLLVVTGGGWMDMTEPDGVGSFLADTSSDLELLLDEAPISLSLFRS